MTSPFFTGPSAPYRNFPVEPQNFQPSLFVIADISKDVYALVTTVADQNYVVGQLVRFVIPAAFGMNQINERTAYVISILSQTQFLVDVNTTQFDPFIPSPPYATTLPQVVAVGDTNTGVISQTGRTVTFTTIPGSFQNISPQ